ncbi:MAG: transposase [Planctomycetota bacterium]
MPGRDYTAPGQYFVTMCAAKGACLFGEVRAGVMRLNEAGHIVREEWARTRHVRPGVDIDVFVVMPNHVHAIVIIEEQRGAAQRAAPTLVQGGGLKGRSLGAIVGQVKSITTKRIRREMGRPNLDVWQRGYHDRVIRGKEEWLHLREYVLRNPANWDADPDNTVRRRSPT